jgi:hypothetical protein
MNKILLSVIYCALLGGLAFSPAMASNSWFSSLYVGQYSDNAFNEIIRFQTELEESHVYVLSVGKELGRLKDRVGMEVEGQFGQHNGGQNHGEINGAFTLRWLPFPWDRYLDTSFAFGNGLSYAFKEPQLEIIENEDNESSQWLYYFLVELAFQVPKQHRWDVFVRIHHRSSVFTLINNVDAGSNFLGLGLRYRFN